MDSFNKQLDQQWTATLGYPSNQKDLFGELLSVFDKDGDGKISNTEAQALWAIAQEAAAEMGDTNALETEEADKLVSKLKLNLTGEEFISVVAQLRGAVCWALAGGNQPETNTPVKIKHKEDVAPGNGIPPLEKYTRKNLEKLYPKNKYDIEEYRGGKNNERLMYVIFDKSSGNRVAFYELNLLKQTAMVNFLNSDGSSQNYYENAMGKIERYNIISSDGSGECKFPYAEELAGELHKALDGGKAKIELLGKSIKNITPTNVYAVLGEYKKDEESGPSLIHDIANADGLSSATKKVFITHIFQQVLILAKENGVYINDLEVKFNEEIMNQADRWFGGMNADYLDVFLEQLKARVRKGAPREDTLKPANGQIDADFRQGNTGDCWLLASIKSIASSPKGLKILNDSIKVNKDGSIDVTLKGPGKTYHITRAELYGNTQLSTGDADVRALEIAVEKFFEEERGSSDTGDRLDINGNWEYIAYEILTGQGGWDHWYPEGSRADRWFNDGGVHLHNPTDEEISNVNKPNVITTVSVSSNSVSNKHLVRQGDHTLSDFTCQTVKGNIVQLFADHAYSVIRTSGNNVYLVNPHNTSDEIIMTISQFQKFFEYINQHELE